MEKNGKGGKVLIIKEEEKERRREEEGEGETFFKNILGIWSAKLWLISSLFNILISYKVKENL